VYCLKIQTMLNNGVPDLWCSAKRDIWLEIKYRNNIPAKQSTYFFPGLSALQQQWIEGRLSEGRNVAVILGSPIGCYIYTNGQWAEGITRNQLTMSRQDVTQWIKDQTLV
jgi:hypothetical protein